MSEIALTTEMNTSEHKRYCQIRILVKNQGEKDIKRPIHHQLSTTYLFKSGKFFQSSSPLLLVMQFRLSCRFQLPFKFNLTVIKIVSSETLYHCVQSLKDNIYKESGLRKEFIQCNIRHHLKLLYNLL